MRIHLSILGVALLAGSVAAQSTNQFFELQGSRTSFTSRGIAGTVTGEALQGFHTSHHIGLAENNGNNTNRDCKLTQLRMIVQDQNCTTAEAYKWVVRSGDDTAGPLGGTAGILFKSGSLNMPTSTSTGACAWQITMNMTSPIALTCPGTTGTTITRDFFASGVEMSPNSNWTMDGMSMHTSFGSAAFPHQNSWNEQVTTGFEEHAWNLLNTSTVATKPSNQRTWRASWATNGVTMQLGCGGGYGMGGMFPASSPSTAPLAYTARVRGGSGMSGGASVAVLGLTTLPVGGPLGSGASVYILTGGGFFFFGPAADANGQAIIPIAPLIPPNINPGGAQLPFQAALDATATGIRVSNVQFAEPK